MASRPDGAHLAAQLVAAHAAHLDVGHDDVGLAAPRSGPGPRARRFAVSTSNPASWRVSAMTSSSTGSSSTSSTRPRLSLVIA